MVLTSLVFLFAFGLKPGIDFTGGSLLHLKFDQAVSSREITSLLTSNDLTGVIVQSSGDNEVIIKTKALNTQEERLSVLSLLEQNFGAFEELRFDSVGPVIGSELKSKAMWQIFFVIIGILLYIAYAFRNIAKSKVSSHISSWKFSWAAILALVHDVVIVIGVFALLGKWMNVEVDILFITAILTTLGFSVNDTIVVFDRIRENMQKEQGYTFPEIIDMSVSQSIVRSVNTSFTVLFVLLALAFFGGQTIFYFVVALIVGVVVGTYSSIFIASPFLFFSSRNKE